MFERDPGLVLLLQKLLRQRFLPQFERTHRALMALCHLLLVLLDTSFDALLRGQRRVVSLLGLPQHFLLLVHGPLQCLRKTGIFHLLNGGVHLAADHASKPFNPIPECHNHLSLSKQPK